MSCMSVTQVGEKTNKKLWYENNYKINKIWVHTASRYVSTFYPRRWIDLVNLLSLIESISGLVAKLCPTFANPWTIAHQTPLSMRFSRQESSSGLQFPSPRDLPDPGIQPGSLALQADFCIAGGFFTDWAMREVH